MHICAEQNIPTLSLTRVGSGDVAFLMAMSRDQNIVAAYGSSDWSTRPLTLAWLMDRAFCGTQDWIGRNAKGRPVGIVSVRWRAGGNDGLLSYAVAAPFRRKRYGTTMVAAAMRNVVRRPSCQSLCGIVKAQNGGSIRILRGAGFNQEPVSREACKSILVFHKAMEPSSYGN